MSMVKVSNLTFNYESHPDYIFNDYETWKFEREQFENNIDSYSEGQKKKILIAKSICEQANIYIWDEPLNYIDIFSRMQIENLIKEFNLTMIFVEHDEAFSNEIATKVTEI